MTNKDSSKIHAIALTKNEEDVVAACLHDALRWADYIYVYDGASTDKTWEIVQQIASDEPRIVAWKQDGKVFSEGLRAEVFEAFRNRSKPGDWWCQLNIDEFFIDDPREFLSRVPKHEHVVWGKFAQYYITHEDVDAIDFEQNCEHVLKQLRYYEMIPTGEARFFRYRNDIKWSCDWAWPIHMGLNHAKRIAIRHYPYRSPKQTQTRLDVRRDNRERGFEGWSYASQKSWKEKIRDRENLICDNGNAEYELPTDRELQHMEGLLRRILKRFMHGLGIWP